MFEKVTSSNLSESSKEKRSASSHSNISESIFFFYSILSEKNCSKLKVENCVTAVFVSLSHFYLFLLLFPQKRNNTNSEKEGEKKLAKLEKALYIHSKLRQLNWLKPRSWLKLDSNRIWPKFVIEISNCSNEIDYVYCVWI